MSTASSRQFRGEPARHGRVVDEHEDRLALHIDALVVIPAVFRRDDAVADEDDVGVRDLRFGAIVARVRDVVVGELERDRLAPRRERRGRMRRVADQIDVLDVGAVGIAGLEAERLELALHVGDGLVLAGRARAASLERVVRKVLDVLEQASRRNGLRGGRRLGRGPGGVARAGRSFGAGDDRGEARTETEIRRTGGPGKERSLVRMSGMVAAAARFGGLSGKGPPVDRRNRLTGVRLHAASLAEIPGDSQDSTTRSGCRA